MATRNSSYFVPLIFLPNVITGPGQYQTRCGEIVTINSASTRHDFGCTGAYADGTAEGWHKSGQIFTTRETRNDIVAAHRVPGQAI